MITASTEISEGTVLVSIKACSSQTLFLITRSVWANLHKHRLVAINLLGKYYTTNKERAYLDKGLLHVIVGTLYHPGYKMPTD